MTGKFEKPGGQENNLIRKWKPMDSSDSQRHRAAEQLTARRQLSLEPSFLETGPQGSLRLEEPECPKNAEKTLVWFRGDSTGIR